MEAIPLGTATVAMRPNNLSASGDQVALVGASKVLVVSGGASTTLETKEEDVVMQCRWVDFGSSPQYIAVALASGVQIWTPEGHLCFTSTIEQIMPGEIAAFPDDEMYMRGIASFTMAGGARRLCVGSSFGSVVVYEHSAAKGSFSVLSSIREGAVTNREAAVNDLAADTVGDVTLLARAAGTNVLVWSTADGDSFRTACTFSFDGKVCTTLRVASAASLLLCGLNTGEIAVHNLRAGAPVATLAAHARWINAVDVHPSGKAFAVAAEDGCVSVWKIAGAAVELSTFLHAPDLHLTGVAFLGAGGQRLCAGAYDTEALLSWPTPPLGA